MNREELKKKIAQIIADYFCPQGNEHKKLWGDDRLCYSKMNFAACEWVAECVDAIIAAGIGDVSKWKAYAKVHRIVITKDDKIKQLYSDEEVDKIVIERAEYKHRAEVAERAGKIAASKVFDYTYEEAVAQAEKELAEEGKDD